MDDQRFEIIRSALAVELRQARENIGLSQEALALSANVDRTYVSQLERGIANPSLLVLSRIATALGCSLRVHLSTFDSHSS
ncbi:helix-turn-helix transcriptional regulator [Thauera sp. CAU 1555]|uniref:Helix-turn-helix transcriptional regulator n=1 Tax=Thauera sedimentorum TaxID=2767595 RepID=A0ABR9BGK8_9RHOO|nr:helix-turn-helix transcriptional regulator [Thauera sedimentorum]MBC9073447.1 helix-turn-helix transcriptional regulator [Thauera sedimentorum]MBD8504366.1 helix-turn-helix transcriptional regulator [Thauera sedimentorum]